MFSVIIIIALVLCVLLVFSVLIQNPKGGGLSGTFGGAANQIFGYKRSTDDIERITWGLVIAVFVLSLTSSAFKPTATQESNIVTPQAQQPAVQSPVNNAPINNADQQNEQPSTNDPLPTE